MRVVVVRDVAKAEDSHYAMITATLSSRKGEWTDHDSIRVAFARSQ